MLRISIVVLLISLAFQGMAISDQRSIADTISSEKNSPVTLFLSGDVMLGRGIDQILPYSTEAILYERYIKSVFSG